MLRARLYVDFDWAGVFDEVTGAFDEPFDVLQEEVRDDGRITFVIDTRGHLDGFVERMRDAPAVAEVEPLDDRRLRVTKEAKGAAAVIREHHGKLDGVDKVRGTKRVFEVLLFRRGDLRGMVEGLREMGDVRVEQLVRVTDRADVLSERQHEAVTAALGMGYFEWPREADAEALADRLGVTHATALEHLRKGERKLLELSLAGLTDRSTPSDEAFLGDARPR